MNKTILLLDLLKDKSQFDKQEDQCFQCQDLVTQPIICDNCSLVYCLKCGSKNSTCGKCKSKWSFQKVQPKCFQLKCPFSTQCQQQLTPQTFINHVLTSDHVQKDIKDHYRQLLGNVCQKGHCLTLMIDTFKNLTHQQCFKCKNIGLARLQCQQCNVIYCVLCRPIKFKNGSCGDGHKLSHVIPKENLPFLCDRCGKKEKTPKGYFIDKKCNIGICQKCMEQIRE